MLNKIWVRYLYTISCLQNTLIIIVCKQTSALHIINPRIYHIVVDRSPLDTSYFTISHGYERNPPIALRSIQKTP
jgi:hypothetical protein